MTLSQTCRGPPPPCQGGPWTPTPVRQAFLGRFPAGCLSDTGTYQGKLPCLAHPQVEQEYRRMMRQFLTDFPGVSMFLVFTLDSNGELCDPVTCPRHQGVSKLTQYNRHLALMAIRDCADVRALSAPAPPRRSPRQSSPGTDSGAFHRVAGIWFMPTAGLACCPPTRPGLCRGGQRSSRRKPTRGTARPKASTPRCS